MTTYTWTDNMMRSGSSCDVEKVADNLMHLKYNAGGLLQISDLGTVTSNFTLDVNKIDLANITASVTISLPTSGLVSGVENKCILDFTTTSSSSPTLPSGLKWGNKNNGVAPTIFSTLSGVRNRLTFITIDGGTTWEAEYTTFGAVETTFIQPTLSANGTLGGSNFAVYASSTYSGDYTHSAFYGADNNSSTTYASAGVSSGFYYTFYNPAALKVSSIAITNKSDGETFTGYTLYASNDNSNWAALVTSTNSITSGSATWSIVVPSGNQGFYNYYKIYVTSSSGNNNGFTQATLTATYIAT